MRSSSSRPSRLLRSDGSSGGAGGLSERPCLTKRKCSAVVRYRSLLFQVPISLRPNYLKLQMAGHAPRRQIDRVLREARPSPLVAAITSDFARPMGPHQVYVSMALSRRKRTLLTGVAMPCLSPSSTTFPANISTSVFLLASTSCTIEVFPSGDMARRKG